MVKNITHYVCNTWQFDALFKHVGYIER